VRAIQIVVLMASAAFLGGNSEALRSASDVHGVPVAVIALPRVISLGVAIHAAGMTEHGNECDEEGTVIGGWSGRLRREGYMRKTRSNSYASKQPHHA
jgi:hypothetical protein